MDFIKGTNTQISPCIAAKAKFALNLTQNKPTNSKTCSYEYWCKVIETLSSQKKLQNKTKKVVKSKIKSLIN